MKAIEMLIREWREESAQHKRAADEIIPCSICNEEEIALHEERARVFLFCADQLLTALRADQR